MTLDPNKSTKSQPVWSSRAESLLGAAPDEQIADAVRAEKWARAADLLALHGERLLLDGGLRPLATSLEALPAEYLTRDGRLSALLAWVHVYEQRYLEARAVLSQAERALQQADIATVAAIRRGEGGTTFELVPHAELKQSIAALKIHLLAVSEGSLPEDVSELMLPASADHPLWRAQALITLGRCRLLAGDILRAREDLETARLLAADIRGARAARVVAESQVLLGRAAELALELDEAKRLYDGVMGTAKETEGLRSLWAQALVGTLRIHASRLELEAVHTGLAALDAYLQSTPPSLVDSVHLVLDAALVRADLALWEGRVDDARSALDDVDKKLVARGVRGIHSLLGARRALHALARRDESQVKRWLQQVQMQGVSEPLTSIAAASQRVAVALVEASMHRPEVAVEHALAVQQFALTKGLAQLASEARVALALAHHRGGNAEQARALLSQVARHSQESGIRSHLVVRGLSAIADELQVASPPFAEAARFLPDVAAPARERSVTPTPGTATGPILTNHEVVPEPATPVESESSPNEVPTADSSEDAALLT